MRRLLVVGIAALAAWLAISSNPAYAQDILGVSFRATDNMPPGTERGTADIRQVQGGYEVSANFSNVADSLKLDDYPDAKAWVIWAVAMDASEKNVGSLNDDLVLEKAKIDFMPAGLIMSAEAGAAAESRTGKDLFRVTLRAIAQTTAQATATTAATATATATTAAPAPTKAAAGGPKELPTTGGMLKDLAVLALVAAALIVGGLQLRRVRL